MRKDCCIVIPIYESHLTDIAEISINSVIYRYYNLFDIYFIHPHNLEISYKDVLIKLYPNIKFLNITEWEDNDIKSYNSMCLSRSFYERFIDYDFILLHQTDAYIFEQNLDYWLNKGYDYIGAPEYSTLYQKIDKTHIYQYTPASDFGLQEDCMFLSYNGGLSLRNVNAFIKALEYIDEHNLKFKEMYICEDLVFSSLHLFDKNLLKLPSIQDACAFSWDRSANYLPVIDDRYGQYIPSKYLFGAHGINGFDPFELNKDESKTSVFLKANILYNSEVKRRIVDDYIKINSGVKTYQKRCCIVIPVYNKIPTLFEELSISNIIRKFNNKYDIYILHSEVLDISYYNENFKVKYIKIPEYIYDNTYQSYSKMCLNPNFYKTFFDYEYMLLAQTDSFVFNEDIDYWINMGYDYIGGANESIHHMDFIKAQIKNPVFIDKIDNNRLRLYNINGGLSLRNVHKFYICSKLLNILIPYPDGEDMVFSMINEISGTNMLNLCPKEICERFSNDYEAIPDEKIENIFGTHYLMKNHQMANNMNKPYSLPYRSFIYDGDGSLDLLEKLNMKFYRHIIKN